MATAAVATLNIPRLRRLRHRVTATARTAAWDVLAAVQPGTPSPSDFVFWGSADEASRRTSATPLRSYLGRHTGHTLIEPRSGFAIADYGILIETSVSNAYAARDPFLQGFLRFPSPLDYLRARVLGHNCTSVDSVISLATAWPNNYYHFYRDFLPKIVLLEDAGVDPAVPVLVPDGLANQPFFREAIRSERLSRWRFIAPHGRFIATESVVFCSTDQFHPMDRSASPEREVLEATTEETTFLRDPARIIDLVGVDPPPPPGGTGRRVFLTRSGVRGRTLANYPEIEPLLRRRGFETVDTEGMSLREQARLLAGARYVVGIHGAGLVNILYASGHDLDLLELRQPGEEHLMTEYRLMCHALGFGHRELFGVSGGGDRDAAFRIDAAAFGTELDRMVTAPPAPGAPSTGAGRAARSRRSSP